MNVSCRHIEERKVPMRLIHSLLVAIVERGTQQKWFKEKVITKWF